jgi:hypothetical protein
MRNYLGHQKEFEDYKNGESTKEMSMERFYEIQGNLRFFEKCLNSGELNKYYFAIHLHYLSGQSVREAAQVLDCNRGSISYDIEKAHEVFARLLVARDEHRFSGKKVLEHAFDRTATLKQITLDEQIELVGEVAAELKKRLEELDEPQQVV